MPSSLEQSIRIQLAQAIQSQELSDQFYDWLSDIASDLPIGEDSDAMDLADRALLAVYSYRDGYIGVDALWAHLDSLLVIAQPSSSSAFNLVRLSVEMAEQVGWQVSVAAHVVTPPREIHSLVVDSFPSRVPMLTGQDLPGVAVRHY